MGGMCLRFKCTATWKQHSLSVPLSTNFTLPFGYTDSVCDAKKPLSAFICHVQQANISALLGQMVQKQLSGLCHPVVCFFPSPVILGFYLSVMLGPLASQSQWEVLQWGEGFV